MDAAVAAARGASGVFVWMSACGAISGVIVILGDRMLAAATSGVWWTGCTMGIGVCCKEWWDAGVVGSGGGTMGGMGTTSVGGTETMGWGGGWYGRLNDGD